MATSSLSHGFEFDVAEATDHLGDRGNFDGERMVFRPQGPQQAVDDLEIVFDQLAFHSSFGTSPEGVQDGAAESAKWHEQPEHEAHP